MTFIQSISNAGGVATVSPLHMWGNVSQVGTTTSSSIVTPSTITSLGASSNSAALTYDAVSLLQSFSPTFSVSGLTKAQQTQLALALGLNASATSTDLTNAINALLTPANPANALVNVLVGGTSNETNSTIPGFLNANGEIAGVPVSASAQATEAVFSTLFGLGTTAATSITSSNNVQTTTANPSAVGTNPTANASTAASEAVINPANPAPNNTQGVAANVPATITVQASGNLPTTNLNPTTNATAALNLPATTTSTAPAALSTANPTQVPPATGIAANIAIAETGATAATAVTAATSAATAATEAIAAVTATITAPAAIIAASVSAAATELVANATASSPVGNTNPPLVTLPETAVTASAGQTIQTAAATPASPPAAAIASTAVNILPPTTAQPATAALPVNAIPFTVNNADSVLRTLLADAASHALITANQTAATYAVPGTVYQLNSGVDHTRQANMKGKLPNIRDTLNPIVRTASTRGALERLT